MPFPTFAAKSRPSASDLDLAFSIGVPHVSLEAYSSLCTVVGGETRWDAAFSAAQADAIARKLPLWMGGNGIKYFTYGLDCSANDGTKDGLALYGAGTAYSKVVVRATTGAILECQGVDRLHLRGIQFSGSCPIGIATGRATVRQWGGHHWYEDVRVIMGDDMSANSGIGTIGFLGIEPEESCWENCEFWANLPVIICPPNNISVQTLNSDGTLAAKRVHSYTPQYTPIVTSLMSNTVFRFTGGCRFVALQCDSPPLVLRSVSSLHLGDTFLQMRGGGSNPSALAKKCPFGIDAENCWNVSWFGTFERGVDDTKTDVGFAILSGTLANWTVSANAGTASSVTPNKIPVIYGVDFTGAVWSNHDIRLRLNGIQAQYPFGWSSATTSLTNIVNCNYDIASTASLATLPQPMFFNASDVSIRMIGSNTTVPVTLRKPTRYRQELVAAKDIAYNTATTVATVVLPGSGMSAGTLLLRNVTMIASHVYTGTQTALITGDVDVGWKRAADGNSLAVTVTRSAWSTSTKTASASLDIAAPTISFVLSGNASFQVQVLPVLSGTGASGVVTHFEADLTCTASYGVNSSTAIVTTQ